MAARSGYAVAIGPIELMSEYEGEMSRVTSRLTRKVYIREMRLLSVSDYPSNFPNIDLVCEFPKGIAREVEA